jgi:uncharacterized membrane protein
MIWTNRLLSLFLYGLAVAFVAGIVHLASVFAMPQVAPHDAFTRLSALAQPNRTVALPQPLPGHDLAPFQDPAMAQAVCIFDLTRGSVRLRAKLESDALVTLSFRSRTGRVFYAMTDRAATKGTIDIHLLTPPQLQAVQADDDEDNPPQELRLVAPELKGFVLIDALVRYPSERPAAEARASSVSCAPEDVAQN